MTRLSHLIIVCGVLATAAAAQADDTAIYESVDDIEIGRIFLTPEQRRWLDANRHAVAQSAGPANGVSDDKDQRDDADAAGYIIGSNGKSRAWAGSDFVEASDRQIERLRFPGEVRVIRHAQDQKPPPSKTKDDDDD